MEVRVEQKPVTEPDFGEILEGNPKYALMNGVVRVKPNEKVSPNEYARIRDAMKQYGYMYDAERGGFVKKVPTRIEGWSR